VLGRGAGKGWGAGKDSVAMPGRADPTGVTLDVYRTKVLISKRWHARIDLALPTAAHAFARYLADTTAPAWTPLWARSRLKDSRPVMVECPGHLPRRPGATCHQPVGDA
jgi:hypothetical protein